MKNARICIRWFLTGMGSVMGISHSLPPASEMTEIEAVGGDFRVIGNDFRVVMHRHPPTTDEARALGEAPKQLELAGIS